ncbi:MAG: ArnT family glycosyltransferase [Planctomycetota bacterium]
MLAIAGLALAARAALAPFMVNIEYYDAIYFDFHCVKEFAAGNFAAGFLHFVPPLFPLLMTPFYLLFDDMEVAGRVLGVLVGTATVWPAYGIAVQVAGSSVARHAALFLALLPFHVYWSVRVSSHATYAFFFALAFWACLRLLTQVSIRRSLVAGLCAGAAYLVRQEVLGLVVVTTAALVGLALSPKSWTARRENRGRLLIAAVCLPAACAVFVLPMMAGTYLKTDRWVLSSKGGVSLFGAGRQLVELTPERDRILWETQITSMEDYVPLSISEAFYADPSGVARAWWRNVRKHFENIARVCGYVLAPFLVVGLLLRRHVPRLTFIDGWFVLLTLFYIATLAFFYDSSRLFLAFCAPFACWIAIGLAELRASWRARLWRPGAVDWLPRVLWVTLAAMLVARPLTPEYGLAPSHQELAGRWIREHLGPDVKIMDPDGNVAFYADGRPDFLPLADLADVLYFAGCRQIEVFAYTRAQLARSRPRLLWDIVLQEIARTNAWSAPRESRPALELLHTVKAERAAGDVEIYRIVHR